MDRDPGEQPQGNPLARAREYAEQATGGGPLVQNAIAWALIAIAERTQNGPAAELENALARMREAEEALAKQARAWWKSNTPTWADIEAEPTVSFKLSRDDLDLLQGALAIVGGGGQLLERMATARLLANAASRSPSQAPTSSA